MLSAAALSACAVVVLLILKQYRAALLVAPVTITALTLYFVDIALRAYAKGQAALKKDAADKGGETAETEAEEDDKE